MSPSPTTPEPGTATITGRDVHRRPGDRWDIRRELSVSVQAAGHRSAEGTHIRLGAARPAAGLAGQPEAAAADEP
jgi:hypothetical protein